MISRLVVLIAISTVLHGVDQVNYDDGASFGKDLSDFYQNNFEDAITKPLTGSDKIKVYEKDELVDNDVHITCDGEDPKMFLKAKYTTTTSGEINLIVQINKNLDGEYDTKMISSISRVCLLGYVQKTSAGNKFYKWNYNNQNLEGIEVSSQDELQSCYCINNECGSPSLIADRKSEILSDIVGGIYPVVAHNSAYIISKGETDTQYVTLYAQSQNCQGSDQYDVKSITNDNFDDKIALTNSEQIDTNSVYYIVSTESSKKDIELSDEDKKFINNVDSDVKTIQEGSTHSDGTSTVNISTGSLSLIDEPVTFVVDLEIIDTPIAQYCEVEWKKKENTAVFADGSNRTDSTEDSKQMDSSIRECTNNFTICPYDPSKGEVIKYNCGQIDDFAEVTSKFAAIAESLKDTICSKIEE